MNPSELSPRHEFFSKEELRAEFELATHDMTFETEQEKELQQLFFTYFSLGALWAVEKIAPGGIIPPQMAQAIPLTKNGDSK